MKAKPVKIIVVIIAIIFTGLIASAFLLKNVRVEYFDSAYSDNSGDFAVGPCETNRRSGNKHVYFVFTEPFPSLDNYEGAKVIKKIDAKAGIASIRMKPGKYGLYMIDDLGDKKLYGDLQLSNPSNNSPRNSQGSWFVSINPWRNNLFFSNSMAC